VTTPTESGPVPVPRTEPSPAPLLPSAPAPRRPETIRRMQDLRGI
jgi:hypothetical protein